MLGGFVSAFIGLILVVVAIAVPPIVTRMVDEALRDAVILEGEDSVAFDNFVDNHDNLVYTTCYVYDLVNINDYMVGAKPVVVERGPYVYTERLRRYNLTWNADGSLLSYRQYKSYEFVKEMSVDDDDERLITSLNIPFMGLRYAMAEIGQLGILKYVYDTMLNIPEKDRLFTRRPVREIMFGYVDSALYTISQMAPQLNINPHYTGIFTNSSLEASMALAKNQYTIHTGKGDLSKIRQLALWENITHVQALVNFQAADAWGTHEASEIRGSEGGQFGVPTRTTDRPLVWFGNTYRSVELEYQEKIAYKDIHLYRFVVPKSVTYNVSMLPSNEVYFQYGPSGLYNMSRIGAGIPMYVTQAQFRDVSPSVSDWIDMVYTAHDEMMESYFDVEPRSGATFHVTTSSQLNFIVSPLENIPVQLGNDTYYVTWFDEIQSGYFPVFWGKQEGGIADDEANEFVTKVYGALWLADFAKYGGSIIGALAVAIGGLLAFFSYRKRQAMLDFSHLPLGASSTAADALVGEKHAVLSATPTPDFHEGVSSLASSSSSPTYSSMSEDDQAAVRHSKAPEDIDISYHA